MALLRGKQPSEYTLDIDPSTLFTGGNAKCLWIVWSHNLSPKASIEHNINKAHRGLFVLGSLGIYNGKQNPLTVSEVYEVCVLPICLYGSENWLLTDPLLLILEAFPAEVGKRILSLLKYHFNLSPVVALKWPSMQYRVLIWKLGFFCQLANSHQSVLKFLAR